MFSENLATQLITHLKKDFEQNIRLLYRGQNELDFLKNWLKSQRKSTFLAPKKQNLSFLKNVITNCQLCGLGGMKKKSIGQGTNKVMVILNNPLEFTTNQIEERKEAFILLQKILQALPLNISDCYLTNLVKCSFPNYSVQPSKVMNNCLSILEKEINIISPLIIMVMGEIVPLQKIKNKTDKINWYQLEHPLMILRQEELKRPTWEILKQIKQDPNFPLRA